MTAGENIRKIRKEKKMTQKQLGELCGINEANIRKYELEKANPKLQTLERIAKALDVGTFELIDFDTIRDNYFNESWDNLENSRISYLKYLGYEIIAPKDNDTFFTIYHEGYKYIIPYNEPSVHYDVICEILDSYSEYTLDKMITQYAIRKEKI